MRSVGQCALALALMCEPALARRAFDGRLADFANVQVGVARERDQVRPDPLAGAAYGLAAA